jgi:UDP-2,4-diacetamido-2,4,6-trideoxy-beta-L-altropyranose hydrolase
MQKTHQVIVRCEVGVKSGYGHLVRCVALTQMLSEEYEIVFVIDNGENKLPIKSFLVDNRILVLPVIEKKSEYKYVKSQDGIKHTATWLLDGYNFDSEYEKIIVEGGDKLITIDDLCNRDFFANAIINVSDGAKQEDYSIKNNTIFCLGNQYALLRKPFLNNAFRAKEAIGSVEEVFISMGGSDISNVTLKVLVALEKLEQVKKINVVIGKVNPNKNVLEEYVSKLKAHRVKIYCEVDAEEMATLMASSQLAICPASGTSYELAATGVPMLGGFTETNQLGILKTLVDKRVIVNLGDLKECTIDKMSKSINKLVNDLELINSLRRNQLNFIDGKSPERIRDLFKRLVNEN